MNGPHETIYSRVPLERMLTDRRGRASFRFRFGTMRDLARHCGVQIEEKDGYNAFSAPKMKLQMFAEKLHFARVKYTEGEPK